MPERRSHRGRGRRGGGDRRPGAGGGGRTMWSGTISFGLVSIPVSLAPAVRGGGVPLRMLDEDGTPLARRYYCSKEDVVVHPEHLLRGYETDSGEYVIVREDELEALAPEKSRDIDLRQFVDLATIEPLLFERPYFLLPAQGSDKAYRLLAQTMEEQGRAGIATFVMREKEYLVAIVAEAGLLRAQTMRFIDEVRTPGDVGLPEAEKPAPSAVKPILAAMRKHSGRKLDVSALHDEHTRRMVELVARKDEKDEDVVEPQTPDEGEEAAVQDLMAALQASMKKARSARPRKKK